eukprot:CAMPEP_0184742018 /NCGR_PEP_ID=MMETSP0315-20130426/5030_1 /TAXON_ID=101924 /ORGANISM="Rhodosorus marinus, Strain UTEX LB 2760" /LENGTH=250 /DNA_ID=CAMNT_0027212661 /DNA_START=65 /DNA_END=817 /DNA_ORIENTATION=-
MGIGRAVLLHGFLGSRVQMLPFAARLFRDGWRVSNYGYESTRFSIEEHARALAESLKDSPEEKTAFVTHSFGGVILRAALSRPECPQSARRSRIVLIAPPLGGSSLARSFRTMPVGLKYVAEIVMGAKSGAQLRDIEFDAFRTALGRFPIQSRILLVVGNAGSINPLLREPSDGVVTVEEVTKGLPDEHRKLVFRATHNVLLYSPTVMSSAVEFLRGNDDVGELINPEPSNLCDVRDGCASETVREKNGD